MGWWGRGGGGEGGHYHLLISGVWGGDADYSDEVWGLWVRGDVWERGGRGGDGGIWGGESFCSARGAVRKRDEMVRRKRSKSIMQLSLGVYPTSVPLVKSPYAY